jgi:F-type H+-transporting ATPase subunit alpha
LISITDGQIYLSPSLFELGVLPAVDVGKSVSRVGGEAQRAAYRAVAGDLKLAYAQFEELETFSRFGARLDDETRKIIEHGQRIRACLKQPECDPVSVPAQIVLLLALAAGLFDSVPLEQMTNAQKELYEAVADMPAAVRERLDTAAKLSAEDRETMIQMARKALVRFQPKPAAEARPQPESKPEPAAKPEPNPGPEAKPDVQPQTRAVSAPEPAPRPKPEAKP